MKIYLSEIKSIYSICSRKDFSNTHLFLNCSNIYVRVLAIPMPISVMRREWLHNNTIDEAVDVNLNIILNSSILQESGLPKDMNAAAGLCSSALTNPNTPPIIVLVDAINQVHRFLTWVSHSTIQ